jgi:hypothetical protein
MCRCPKPSSQSRGAKENELKALKSEPPPLDRKITAELAPRHDEKDGEEVKRDEPTRHVNRADVPAQSIGSKDSMVEHSHSIVIKLCHPLFALCSVLTDYNSKTAPSSVMPGAVFVYII